MSVPETHSETHPETRTEAPQGQYLNNFVLIPDVFTPEECRRIIYCNLPASQAHVVSFDKENPEGMQSYNDLQMHSRNTKVKSVSHHQSYQWMYDRVLWNVRLVNDRFFRFRIERLTALQVLEYENTGFYGTHIDVGTGETSLRKLSMVLFLTPPEEYTGGELVVKPWFKTIERKQGSALFFPSYLPHEITPVTSGVRHTMVTWVLGPCFK